MSGITTYISMLTLNVNVLNPPIKNTIWQNGLKRKIQQFFAYRRPNSLTETSIGLSERLKEDLARYWPTKKDNISYKVDFKPTLIK
jgi:hypothetical protein